MVLTVLDGWGIRGDKTGNAPLAARTPNLDRLAPCPRARLAASGEAVGLPPGQIGNSEVGHTVIGAGRVVWATLPRIDRAIADGSLSNAPALTEYLARMRASGGAVHLMGLVGAGGVHAHRAHIAALAGILSQRGIAVEIHAFLDGRDQGPKTARGEMIELLRDVAPMPGVRVATVCGRFYAMDRDRRWDRTAAAWRLIANGESEGRAEGPLAAVDAAWAAGRTDEFVAPVTTAPDYAGIRAGDGLLAANFRADRMRQLLQAFLDPQFDAFPVRRCGFAAALGMVRYSDALARRMGEIFPPDPIVNTLGAWAAACGKRQFRLAETEKYPHVTYFLNGGVERPHPGETRRMVPSPKVRTYDLQPEMSCPRVAAELADAIRGGGFDLIVANFANPDMVGHTGSLKAAVAACEAVDAGLGLALDALDGVGGTMLVTSDHGNCETMIDPETGGPHTAHTLNPVPVVLVARGAAPAVAGLADGGLADLAPTVLDLMGVEPPPEMTGRSLLRRA